MSLSHVKKVLQSIKDPQSDPVVYSHLLDRWNNLNNNVANINLIATGMAFGKCTGNQQTYQYYFKQLNAIELKDRDLSEPLQNSEFVKEKLFDAMKDGHKKN